MRWRCTGAAAACFLLVALCVTSTAFADCGNPANAIERENCLQGAPDNQWDITQSGDATIQGFATDISVNAGQTVYFKVQTDAASYHFDIYRLGYYGGNGARLVAPNVRPSAALPQSQPPCLTDVSLNLVDCGNWAVSGSWTVPATAVSGIYFALLTREDTGGTSHIVFIVRNDASHSDVLFQTSDETWQAYNGYGGHSLYGPEDQFDITHRAFKVSYNRPFETRSFENASWVFYAEYPMVRWLESNGYDVTYSTSVDAARNGSLIKNHKLYLSVGHDEYASAPKRASIEAARDAGVNLAFFSGNEFFWKTRWENSTDGSNTPYRTLVCYKESAANAVIDPQDPPTWTGTWRDPRFSPPADGGRPENALTGTLFQVNGFGNDNSKLSIQVPADDGKMRFWRNTVVASQSPGQVWFSPGGVLGYEWDIDADNGARPAGIVRASTATYTLTTDYLIGYGVTTGAGIATHHLTMYRAPSGALVFGAGTVQWSFGLDSNHDWQEYSPQPTDISMQQATVNLFADMGVQPVTLQPGLAAATMSADTVPPQSTITSPSSGATIQGGTAFMITGTAADSGGGVVGGVEVSVDGGQTWHPANGRESWSYAWNPAKAGMTTLMSRAVDDSGNLETPSSGISVMAAAHDCPCSIWSPSTTPGTIDSGDGNAGEFGVRFKADYDGYITGIRFYKASVNNGTHIGHLWTNSGALLASATFTGETGSGWQQVSFSNPVAVTANTVYVASYFTSSGHYSTDAGYFVSGFDDIPLHALADGASGINGAFSYGSAQFPANTFGSANYWVDVVYLPGGSMPGAPSSMLANPSALNFTAYSNEPAPAAQNVNIYNQGTAALAWTASGSASWIVLSAASGTTPSSLAVSVDQSGLAAGTYSGSITISSSAGTQTVAVTVTVAALLATEDFTNGSIQGWIPSSIGSPAGWSFTSGGLHYNGAGLNQLYAGDTSWTDYSFQVQLDVDTLNNYPGGIRGRVNPATGAGYLVWLYPANANVRLFKATGWNINNGLTELAGSPGVAGITAGGLHTVALSFQGSQIKVLVDGNVVITANDSTYTSGLVALDVFNQPITYKNLLITVPTLNPADLTLSQTSLSFTGNLQGPNPAAQTVQVGSSTASAAAWTASSNAAWLTASSSSPLTPGNLQVSVNTSQLAAGTYNGTILLTSLGAGNSPAAINVTLNVVIPPPAIVLAPTSMSFVALTGQSAPPAQALSIVNGGLGAFSWSASSDSTWLTASAASGTTPSTVNIAVNQAGLSAGTYNGNITISATGIPNSPQTVPVTLKVLTPDMTEDFSDMAHGWIISPLGLGNGWSVSNGVYSFNGSGLSLTCSGNSGWTDYDFDTNIKLASLNNWPGGVRGRVNPSTGAGYAVWLYPGSSIAVLYRVPGWNINDAGLTTLATANLSFDASAFHDLTMSFRGNQISVLWDGQPLMTVTDSTYSSGFVCMDADSQPISYSNIRVASTMAAVTLDTPSPLVFSAQPGSQPGAQTANITAGGQTTTWAATSNASWLQVSASSTMTPGTITASVSTSGLAEGTYNGSITIYAPGATNSPLVIPVTLAIKTAVLSTAPASLTFFGASGYSTPGQNLTVTNAGTGALSWSASADSSWIDLSTTSGSAPSSITVSPGTTGLANGAYSGNITIASPDVGNSPATIPVSLQMGNLAFLDNFSSGAGNWTISPVGNASGWSVNANGYAFNGQGPSQSWAGDPTWTNYVMSVDFTLASTNNYPGGIRGRVNTTTGAAYGVWIYPGTSAIRLWRMTQWNIDTDSGLTLLGQPASAVFDTNTHNLKLEFVGSQISVYYDDRLVIQATDSTYTQGAVALEAHDKPITFNQVAVISF